MAAPIRRLHARWRQPALITECHPILGPFRASLPTIRGCSRVATARHLHADAPVLCDLAVKRALSSQKRILNLKRGVA